MPQDKKTKQTKASKPKEKPSLLIIGYLDLVFKLDLTDKDLEKKNASKEENKDNKDNKDDKETKGNKDNDDKYYKIEDFSDIKSLEQILKDNKSLWDRIVLKPGNDSVKQILIGNKASKKKCGVEYIGYGRPKFEGDDEYFDEIFNYVTEKNHLFVNKTPLDDGARSSLTIILTHKGKTQTIGNGTTPEEDAKEKEKKRRRKERKEKKKAEEEKKKKEEEKRLAEEENKKNQDENQEEKKDENQEERKDENQEERKDENQDEKKDENQDERKDEKKDENKDEKKDENQDKEKKDEKQNGKQNEKTDEKKDEKKEEEEEDKDLIFGDEDSDEGEEEDYEENEAMKAKKIPKFKRKNSVLTKLNPSQTKYDMFYISYYDLKDFPGDFKMQDLLELLNFFKKQGTNVFVNFYKPKPPEPPQVEDDGEDDDDHENDNEIKGEGETKEEQEEEQEEEKKKEKKEKKNEDGPSKKMIQLNQLIDFSQIFFFDTKQAPKLFNAHYEAFTEDNKYNRKPIGRTKIFDYFITGIATATKEEVSGIKTGLFMDDYNKFNVIFTSKKAASKQEFDAQPHPKRNHINQKLIDDYREIIDNNKNDYYSILLSLLVTTLAAAGSNCQSIETIYPAFVIALEIIKRKVECEKNKLQQDDSLYQVKVSDKALAQELEKFAAGDKESGFVLDCTNKDKSTMKDYVPLYDYHLKGYFSSEVIRKDLKNKGFINTKGFVMYDSVYRDVMNTKPKKKKKNKDEEAEEKNTKIMSSIKGIDVPSRIQDKEINAEQAAKSQNTDTGRKLPFIKDNPVKKKKVKKHRGTGSKSGSGSGSSSSGEESSSEEKSGEGSGSGSGSGSRNKDEESAAKE